MDATKIHKKFADEKQCQNPRCGGYFLSKEPKEYCPGCEAKGIGNPEKEYFYKEVNTENLAKQVAELRERIEVLEKTALKKANRSHKKKTFEDKKCANCGKKFTPAAPNQQLCSSCRKALTN